MKVLVTGARGLVGTAVVNHCRTSGDEIAAYDRQTLDISDRDRVIATVREERPDAVINCAAWTDVDGCESDPEKAFAVNAHGPENLASACAVTDSLLITISTDYVFDGRKSGYYTQRDQPNPESVYAKAKFEGERAAQKAWTRTIVVRSGYIFGSGGRNFLSTVVQRAKNGDRLKVIGDAFGTPTYAVDLAARLRELAVLGVPEIFHVVNDGPGASFEEFSREALRVAGCPEVEMEVVSSKDLPRPAPRPANSRLKCIVSPTLGLAPLPQLQTAIERFVRQL